MKILILTECYPRKSAPNQGIFIHRQALALREIGVDIEVIQPVTWYPPLGLHKLHPYWRFGKQERDGMYDEVDGIKIYHPALFIRIPSRFFSRNKWELMGLVVGKFIKRKRNLRKANWIYAQFLCHEGYAGIIASKISGIKLAAIARGDDVHAWPDKNPRLVNNIQEVVSKANCILATSNKLANDTQSRLNGPLDRSIHVLYNGIDLQRFKPNENGTISEDLRQKLGLPPGVRLMICVGTPVILKGWLELLDCVRDLGALFDNWMLLMVAPHRDNVDALDLEGEAGKRGIRHKVKHLGSVRPIDMPDILRLAELFVLPSYNEGLSNAVLEAMATGLSVVTTRVGGHSEVITNGHDGILVQPRDRQDLLQAVTALLKDDKLRREIALNARKTVSKLGTFRENAERLVKILNQN
jgi:teichuronic acid biosynthesis glycosyltransferase TuaC